MIKKICLILLLSIFPSFSYSMNIDLTCERPATKSDLSSFQLDERGNVQAGTFDRTSYIKRVRIEIRGNNGYFYDSTANGLFNSSKRELREIKITNASIRAVYTHSFLSSPKIEINRYSGIMTTINSLGKAFQYQCKARDISKKLF